MQLVDNSVVPRTVTSVMLRDYNCIVVLRYSGEILDRHADVITNILYYTIIIIMVCSSQCPGTAL